MHGEHQRGHARHMRRRLGGARFEVVAELPRPIRGERLLQNAVRDAVVVLVNFRIPAGRDHAQGRAVVAVVGGLPIEARGADADHPRVGRRINRGVAAVVAGRRHDHHPFAARIFDRIPEGVRVVRGPETDVDDLGAMVRRKADPIRQGGGGAGAVRAQHLDRHNVRARGHSRTADHTRENGNSSWPADQHDRNPHHQHGCKNGDRSGELRPGNLHEGKMNGDHWFLYITSPGNVRAVAVVVVRMSRVMDEIPTVDEGGLCQVRRLAEGLVVLVSDAGVQDGDHHSGARGAIPGAGDVDAEPGVGEVPLIRGEIRIIGQRQGLDPNIRLREADARITPKPLRLLSCRATGSQGEHMVGTPVPFTAAQRATPLSQNGPVRRLAAGMIANDEFFARGTERRRAHPGRHPGSMALGPRQSGRPGHEECQYHSHALLNHCELPSRAATAALLMPGSCASGGPPSRAAAAGGRAKRLSNCGR